MAHEWIGGGCKADIDALNAECPGLEDHIREMVASWPPMPPVVVDLWRAARAQYIKGLVDEQNVDG